jgi:hypothetical protein
MKITDSRGVTKCHCEDPALDAGDVAISSYLREERDCFPLPLQGSQ